MKKLINCLILTFAFFVFLTPEVYIKAQAPEKRFPDARIAPYLSSGGYNYYLYLHHLLNVKQSEQQKKYERINTALDSYSNVLVNDPAQPGLTQSEASLGVSHVFSQKSIVVCFNDAGGFIETNSEITGLSFGTDELGRSNFQFQDLGGLIGATNTNQIFWGDPAVTSGIAPLGVVFYVTNLYLPRPKTNGGIRGLSLTRGYLNIFQNKIDWSSPLLINHVGNDELLDKEYVAVDDSVYPHRVYVTYTRLNTHNNGKIELMRSFDGGTRWEGPIIVQASERIINQGSFPIVAPDGTLYVAWERDWFGQNPEIRVARSVNFGESFDLKTSAAPVRSIAWRPPRGYNRLNINDFPSGDADSLGNIYLTYHSIDKDARPNALDPNIFMVKSTNKGVDWSIPVKVNDDKTDQYQFFPRLSVDRSTNTVGIAFYDRRNATPDASTSTDVYMAISRNGGLSFAPNVKITDVASDWLKTQSDMRPNFGDYIDLKLLENFAYVVWADGRLGDPDIRLAQVPLK